MKIKNRLKSLTIDPIPSEPLAVVRIIFGLLMLASVLRIYILGWIEPLYIQPRFFFKYYGFEWVQSLGELTYPAFFLLAVLSLFIALGLFYRISIIAYFLIFTYIEFIDKTLYLNHYYFVSLFAFILIFTPAGKIFSLDNYIFKKKSYTDVQAWTINILKFQLCVVYFYAGLAKLNYDWLFNAMPLKLWLPANSHIPIVGTLLNKEITAYIFSWFGAIYDLTIWYFLLNKLTRPIAYVFVIIFHLSTAVLFNIGMFPYIMTFITLIFFSSEFHRSIINLINPKVINTTYGYRMPKTNRLIGLIMTVFVLFQLIWPLRSLQYPGNLFWHEQGYRFSWRVMLMEKAGYCIFKVNEASSNREVEVVPSDYLSPKQCKQMASQPDMILQFAHFIKSEFEKKGWIEPEVRVNSRVTLNGKAGKSIIDPQIDLTKLKDGFSKKEWITEYE